MKSFYLFNKFNIGLVVYFFLSYNSFGQYVQIGNKLVGTGAQGTGVNNANVNQGMSVCISADGKTMAVGGDYDNSTAGAVWIYTLSGSNWIQVGSKLVGTGANGSAHQGASVSLSADGKILAVGGNFDGSYSNGAVWVYSLTGINWTQMGSKLVGTGEVLNNGSSQGVSVSLSSDGKTLAVGGYSDNSNLGAVWIYTLSGSNWTQIGNKLVGTGAIGGAQQGISVSLSSDGRTLAVGGNKDNANAGAVWIFTSSGGSFSQLGNKIIGAGSTDNAIQGISVSLSSNGQILAFGGIGDNSNVGAAWVFSLTGANWTQMGNKLTGTGTISGAFSGIRQGFSISLSGDGQTLAVGGYGDNSYAGAVWIYTLSGSNWSQVGNKLVGTGAVGKASQGWSVSLPFDGKSVVSGGYQDKSSLGAVWVFNYLGIPTAIEEKSDDLFIEIENSNLHIFPNPTNGLITINALESSDYNIMNGVGLVVKGGFLNQGRNTINLELSQGIYYFISNGEVKKLVVN